MSARPASQPKGDLTSTEALVSAGFQTDERAQARFTSRVVQRMYAMPELITRPEVLAAGGLGASLMGVAHRMLAQDLSAAAAAGCVGGLHLMLLISSFLRQRRRSQRAGPQDFDAAFLGDDGSLKPRLLGGGETVVIESDIDGRDAVLVRLGAGLFQTSWGLVLGGLPLAVGGASHGAAAFGLTVAATFVGTSIFGRGLRTVFGLRAAKRLVLTNRRLIILAGPGAAKSARLTELLHRPVVLVRQNGKATVCLALEPRASLSPLPVMGLWGLDQVAEETARHWANATMEARRPLVAGRPVLAIAAPSKAPT